MFESKLAFKALANDPTRWAFGYVKVAGLVLAILMTARFWAFGTTRAALLIPPKTLLHILFAIGLTLLAELPFTWIKDTSASPLVDTVAAIISMIIQAGLLVYIVGAVLGDNTNSIKRSFTERWPTALLIALLAALAFVPSSALHLYNHKLAIGQPNEAVLWALMAFDSLIVGLLSALVGAGLFVAYRAKLTWRGWPTSRSG